MQDYSTYELMQMMTPAQQFQIIEVLFKLHPSAAGDAAPGVYDSIAHLWYEVLDGPSDAWDELDTNLGEVRQGGSSNARLALHFMPTAK